MLVSNDIFSTVDYCTMLMSSFAFQQKWMFEPEIIKPPNQMAWAMRLLGELRRNRRTKLKKKKYKVKDASIRDVKLAKPQWADKQDYEELVDYWFDPKMVVSIFSCSIIFYWFISSYDGFFLSLRRYGFLFLF